MFSHIHTHTHSHTILCFIPLLPFHSSFTVTLNILCYKMMSGGMILKPHSRGISQAMALSPANPHLIWSAWTKVTYRIEPGFLHGLWWMKTGEKKLFGSFQPSISCPVGEFWGFYTKKLSLIIKFSDCSFLKIVLDFTWTHFPSHAFFLIGSFHPAFGSICLWTWGAIIVHRLAFWFFCP